MTEHNNIVSFNPSDRTFYFYKSKQLETPKRLLFPPYSLFPVNFLFDGLHAICILGMNARCVTRSAFMNANAKIFIWTEMWTSANARSRQTHALISVNFAFIRE